MGRATSEGGVGGTTSEGEVAMMNRAGVELP